MTIDLVAAWVTGEPGTAVSTTDGASTWLRTRTTSEVVPEREIANTRSYLRAKFISDPT